MNTTDAHLDFSLLEKLRHSGDKVVARCPACAECGGDGRAEHLVIFSSGKFACAGVQGDAEHRRRIFALVGVKSDRPLDPAEYRRMALRRTKKRREREQQRMLVAEIKAARNAIIARHPWERVDVWESSPQRIDCPLVEFDPVHFISTMFPPDGVLWTGKVFESGERMEARWRTCREWRSAAGTERIGPMTTPAIWKPGTTSRIAAKVAASPYTVLDFDGFDGVQPCTAAEHREHIDGSLALVRWLRDDLDWPLAAMLWSGSKSIHAWFHTPPPDVLEGVCGPRAPYVDRLRDRVTIKID